jgi:hypothetical protein
MDACHYCHATEPKIKPGEPEGVRDDDGWVRRTDWAWNAPVPPGAAVTPILACSLDCWALRLREIANMFVSLEELLDPCGDQCEE